MLDMRDEVLTSHGKLDISIRSEVLTGHGGLNVKHKR